MLTTINRKTNPNYVGKKNCNEMKKKNAQLYKGKENDIEMKNSTLKKFAIIRGIYFLLHPCLILISSAAMAEPVVIDISFYRLLHSIYTKFSLPPARYGVSLDATCHFRAYVDVAVPRVGPMTEMIMCWGMSSTNVGRTQEDATMTPVERLREELHFEVKDSNYADRRFYENLYDQIAGEYDALQDQHELL